MSEIVIKHHFILPSFAPKLHIIPTCFPISLGVHYDKLRTELADPAALQDGHEAAQVLQVEREAGPTHLGVVLCAFHGAVKALAPRRGVADKVPHVVGVRDGGLRGDTSEPGEHQNYQNYFTLNKCMERDTHFLHF